MGKIKLIEEGIHRRQEADKLQKKQRRSSKLLISQQLRGVERLRMRNKEG